MSQIGRERPNSGRLAYAMSFGGEIGAAAVQIADDGRLFEGQVTPVTYLEEAKGLDMMLACGALFHLFV